MKLQIERKGAHYSIDTAGAIDISIGIKRQGNVNAYYLDEPVFEPFRSGDFVGSVREGGPVNCESIRLYPHGNGTHTECVGHIADLPLTMLKLVPEPFMPAQVISVMPGLSAQQDMAITLDSLAGITLTEGVVALVVRTLPNDLSKLTADYSGQNPVYFTPEAILWMKVKGIRHLLTDLPSVDPEIDGGKMLAHRAFFQYPEHTDNGATITELIYVPDAVTDGLYMLNLQTAPIETDAVPSRPLLFPIVL